MASTQSQEEREGKKKLFLAKPAEPPYMRPPGRKRTLRQIK